MCLVVEQMLRDTAHAEEEEAELGGMRQYECVHSGEISCLSMRVGWGVGGCISVPPGPRSGGSERGFRTVQLRPIWAQIDLCWRFSAAESQADVGSGHAC